MLAVVYFIVLLVFGTLQIEICAQQNDNETANLKEVKEYDESVHRLQKLGKSLNTVVDKIVSIQQEIQNILTKANSSANQTQLDFLKSLELFSINSQECTQTSTKTGIINQTNQEILTVLNSLKELKIIERDLNDVNMRIIDNDVSIKINVITKCKNKVIKPSEAIVNGINCYKQIPTHFSAYILSQNNTVNKIYKRFKDIESRVNLNAKFFNIVKNAKKEIQDIFLCQIKQNQINVYNAVLKKLIKDNKNEINTKANKVIMLINKINSNNNTIIANFEAEVNGYISPIGSLFTNTLNLFPNNTKILSSFKLLRSEVKAGIISSSTLKEMNSIITLMNKKVTEQYVNAQCQQYSESLTYNICVKDVLEELGNIIKNADNLIDNLLNQAVQLSAFNAGITNSLNTSLSNVFNSTLLETLNIFTQSLQSSLSVTIIEVGNTYNKLLEKLSNYNNTASSLLSNTYNKLVESVEFVKPHILRVNFNNIKSNLIVLKGEMDVKLENSVKIDIDFERFNFNIDASNIDSELRKCTSNQSDFKQVFNNCIKPIITNFNLKLKVELSGFKNLSEKINILFVKLDKNLDEFVKNFTFEFYRMIKKHTEDYELFIALVESYDKNVFTEKLNISKILLKTSEEENKLGWRSDVYWTDYEYRTRKELAALWLAITVAERVNVKGTLSQYRPIFDKLFTDGNVISKSKIFETIDKYANLKYYLKADLRNLLSKYSRQISNISSAKIAYSCRNVWVNDIYYTGVDVNAYIRCVERTFFNDYYENFKALSQQFKDHYNNMTHFTLSFDTILNSSVVDGLKHLKNVSDSISNEIFLKSAVTNNQVLDSMIYNNRDNSYMKSDISQMMSNRDLQEGTTILKRKKIDKFNKAGGAVYDLVGISIYLFGNAPTDLINGTVYKINSIINAANAKSPNFTSTREYAQKVSTFAKVINSIQNYQVSLLNEDGLKVLCPLSLAYNGIVQDLYDCFEIQIKNKFRYYYNSQVGLVTYYRSNFLKYLENTDKALNKWNDEFFTSQVTPIETKAKEIAEKFYKQHNITVDQLINYSVYVAEEVHYNNFQQRILENVTAINNIRENIIRKMYKLSIINSRLQSAVSPVQTAIEAVMETKNKSMINEEINTVSVALIKDGETAYNKFILDLKIQSDQYKDEAKLQLAYRDQSYKQFKNILSSCTYNLNAYIVMSDVNSCIHYLLWKKIYIESNVEVVDNLLSIKEKIQNFEANSMNLMDAYVKRVINEQKNLAFYYAYKIYHLAGLPTPKDVALAIDLKTCVKYRHSFITNDNTYKFICEFVM